MFEPLHFETQKRALTITYTILGAPLYYYSILSIKAPILKPLPPCRGHMPLRRGGLWGLRGLQVPDLPAALSLLGPRLVLSFNFSRGGGLGFRVQGLEV